MENSSSVLTLEQFCEVFGVTSRTVHRWRRQHGLPAYKPSGSKGSIFFLADDVESWLRRQGAETPPRPLRRVRERGAVR